MITSNQGIGFINKKFVEEEIKNNKIVVLDNGNVVGIGTHKELLKNCDVYKEIAYSQLSRKELENA